MEIEVVRRQSAFWKGLGVYSLIIAATLAGAEILARLYAWEPPRSLEPPTNDGLGLSRYVYSPNGYGDLVPRQDGHWIIWYHRPYHVQTNTSGLRNTEEPRANAFRVLAVGDSQTFGPYLANEDTWPAWLENFSRLRDKQRDIQVFNAGISGYSISDQLAYLRDKGVAFAPSLVVLATFENDVLDLRHGDTIRIRQAASTSMAYFRRFSQYSALMNVAYEIKTRLQLAWAGINIRIGDGNPQAPASASPPGPAPEDPLQRRYGELFREAASLLRERNIRFAVVYIPTAEIVEGTATSGVEPLVRALAGETGTPYLDLTSAMQGERDAPSRLYLLQRDPQNGSLSGNGHLSREGNAVVGRTVGEWLEGQRLIPAVR
jgi:lysophospholipase L1-like esterase